MQTRMIAIGHCLRERALRVAHRIREGREIRLGRQRCPPDSISARTSSSNPLWSCAYCVLRDDRIYTARARSRVQRARTALSQAFAP